MSDKYQLWRHTAGAPIEQHRLIADCLQLVHANTLKVTLEKELFAKNTRHIRAPRRTNVHRTCDSSKEIILYVRRPGEETYHITVNGAIVRTRYSMAAAVECYDYYVDKFTQLKCSAKIKLITEKTSGLRNTDIDAVFVSKYMPDL